MFTTCVTYQQAIIICFLFNIKRDSISRRESQIYEEFTVSEIYCHKPNKYISIESLEELQGGDKLQFDSICELAFEMTINSQQVVSKRKAQKSLYYTTKGSFFSLLTIYQNECHSRRSIHISSPHIPGESSSSPPS